MTTLTKFEIATIINENLNKKHPNGWGRLNSFGIRTCDEKLEVGDRLSNSYVWDYENDCSGEEEIEGCCCTGIREIYANDDSCTDNFYEDIEKALDTNSEYAGEYQYLVAGSGSEYGDDSGEEIIQRAIVLAIL